METTLAWVILLLPLLGGITLAEAPACWRAGAASVAVIRELEASSDRRTLVASYREAARKAGMAG